MANTLSYDPAKREQTLKQRKLDFEDAFEVFSGNQFTFEDLRKDYGETRKITVGYLGGRMVIVVWTPRMKVRHIISMRKANDREKKYYKEVTQGILG
jgi:uncharacterized DUF497 family protein